MRSMNRPSDFMLPLLDAFKLSRRWQSQQLKNHIEAILADLELRVGGRFVSPASSRSRYGGERLQRGRSAGFPKGSALYLLGEASCRVSTDDNEFLHGIGGTGPQRLVPPVFENESNRLSEIGKTFLARCALPIRARNLRAVGNVPSAVLLHYRRKLVAHAHILPP